MSTPAPRLDLAALTPELFGALAELSSAGAGRAAESGLEPALTELVRLRASQINGCGYCHTLHTDQARRLGERDERLQALAHWPGSPLFTPREKAALRLAEAVTLVHDGQVGDDVYRAAREHLDEPEIAALLWIVALINVYNRLAIAARIR